MTTLVLPNLTPFSFAILIQLTDKKETKFDHIKNLSFSNIQAKGPHFFTLKGREDCYLENISFSNCSFQITDGKEYPNARYHGGVSYDTTDYVPVTIRYVKNFKMDNVDFNVDR